MTLPDTSIKVVVRERALSPSIWSLGIVMSLTSSNYVKTMVRRKIEPEIYSTPFGSLIFSWRESEMMATGLWCVQTNVLDSLMFGEMPSINYILNMKQKAEADQPSRQDNSGRRLSMYKLVLELPTCFIRMPVIKSQINKILALSNHRISAPKLFNTQTLMKLPYAILHQSTFRSLSTTENLTMRAYSTSLKS